MEINGYLIVPGADLTGAKLSVFELRDTDLRTINFEEADLSDTNFTGSNLAETLFWRANLRSTNFTNANLSSTSFWEANLEGAVLTDTTIGSTTGNGGDEYTDFLIANLRGADLSDNDWSGFEPIDMSKANLEQANLSGGTFMFTLDEASLVGANLRGTHLTVDSYNADFSKTDCRQAHFQYFSVNGSKFFNANLSDSTIKNCKFGHDHNWGEWSIGDKFIDDLCVGSCSRVVGFINDNNAG